LKSIQKDTEKVEKTTKVTKSKKKEAPEMVTLSSEMSSSDVASLKQNYIKSDNKIGKATQDSEYSIILNDAELDELISKIKESGVSSVYLFNYQ
jgi:hypothetical protein